MPVDPSEVALDTPRALRDHPTGPAAMAAVRAALAAADPAAAVARFVHRTGRFLVVGERPFDLDAYGRIRIVGAGKASEAMTRALLGLVGDRVHDGLVITKDHAAQDHAAPEQGAAATTQAIGPVRILRAEHPEPGPASAAASSAIIDALRSGEGDDLVIALISGGASSLLTGPTRIPLASLAGLTRALMHRGADIEALNTVRQALDDIKAGGLARRAAPATVIGLLLSDVPGDVPALIGSGPTVPLTAAAAADLPARAAAVVESLLPAGHELRDLALAALRPGETPPPTSAALPDLHNVVVGGNGDAMRAAALAASEAGYPAALLPNPLVGEAGEAGRSLGALLAAAPEGWPLPLPAALIAGGETTVRIDPHRTGGHAPGRGGRTLELALAAMAGLEGSAPRALVSLATDGDDGNSATAGAVVTERSAPRARAAGLDPQAALRTHDTAAFFDALGDTLRPGPTGTNVCDLAMLFAG